jgi:serine phosphatase RsbU (regulator of sigma subunit)
MSLRTRLIIAFLFLSVVPLTAVTLFWYASSVSAFERAAQREAAESAADIGRRMELITADVGRRVDRVFDVESSLDADLEPDPAAVRARVAPMLGDRADLVDRVEFHPADKGSATIRNQPAPPSTAAPPVPAPAEAPGHAEARRPWPPGPPPGRSPMPRPPTPIVVDVPKIMEEVRRETRQHPEQLRDGQLGSFIDNIIAMSLPAAEAGVAAGIAAADAATRQAAATAATRLQMELKGRQLEVVVRKRGKLVGKANATLNLDRMLHTVFAFARREQGEIPFAIDREGSLYTPDEHQRARLRTLGVQRAAPAAADAAPRRVGDWIVVARRDAGGLIFGIARPIGESLREIRRMSFRNLSMGLLVIGLACIGIVPISHRMTQHVSSLTAGVRQLAGGDFKARVPVKSRDEFGALAAAFNRMAEDLERHQALVVEQERLHRELELSRLIQTEMLPHAPLRLGPAEIKGVSIPAREVGGDFFNYFALADGRMALLVGDVSGKGVSAALLMANVQATLRARLPLETELARLTDTLDREIDENTPCGVYVTLFLAILDVDRRVLRYVNAGHNPQFLLRARGGIQALSSTGMPIALYSGQGYRESEVEIATGDLLFFYTDGLVETENEANEMFGAERLQTLLAAEQEQGVDTVLERVEREVRSFRGHAEPFDDATMMALRINA